MNALNRIITITLLGLTMIFLSFYPASAVNVVTSPGTIPNAFPVITALSPLTVAVGSPAFKLTVNGTGFLPVSLVRWNGSDRTTTYLSSTQLVADIPATDVSSFWLLGFPVTVYTPPPGGGTSSKIDFYNFPGIDLI